MRARLPASEIVEGVTLARSGALPELFRGFDQVWQWYPPRYVFPDLDLWLF